jgi:hypothetical protein
MDQNRLNVTLGSEIAQSLQPWSQKTGAAGAELLRASERAILSVAAGDLVGRIQNGSVEPYSLSAGFGVGLRGRAALPKAWRSADTPDP